MATGASRIQQHGLAKHLVSDVVWLLRAALGVLGICFRLMFFLYAIPLMRSANKEEKYEGHGYFVWAAALWMFAVPEIYGFAAGRQGRLPTLSSTVGNLINVHDWMSVFVIVLLFASVVQVVRVQIPAHRQRQRRSARAAFADEVTSTGRWTLTASESGRVTRVGGDVELPVDGRYEIYAAVLTVIAFAAAVFANAPKQIVGECGYGVLFVLLYFVPGILAYRHDTLAPFPGLFTTVGFLERKSPAVAVIVGGGLVFLALHLTFYPFPSILPDIQGLHHHCQSVSDPGLCVNPAP